MGRRIILFALTNILIIGLVTTVTQVLGLNVYMTQYGIDHVSLAIFCAVWGMGASFISLLMSKQAAKWGMRLQMIDPNTSDPTQRWLVDTVHRLAQKANLPKMPEVAIYPSQEVNAFATGPSKSNSLVAVSAGLMGRMNKDEVEGVLGHEVAHIANGDMVTMTLLQGVINAFVMYLARVVSFAVVQAMRGDREGEGPGQLVHFGLVIVFQILFGILGSLVVSAFSRWREYRADYGGAELAGRQKMIAGLQRLSGLTQLVDNSQPAMANLKISGAGRMMALLSTHPPLEDRIQRLRDTQIA